MRPGYKLTDAGLIPDEWVVSSLQGACRETITYGIVQCGPHIRDGIPYVRVSDMDKPELEVDGMLRTSRAIAARFSRSTVQQGDLVYALRGKLGEVRRVGSAVAGANLTQGTARLAPKETIDGAYLLWAMRSSRVVRQAEIEAKGTTFREITLVDLRRICVPVPCLAEQRAIATALSDVDALLGGLALLIAKKRDLKQAAMQQLLTGQIHLPGFHGEWEVKRLGEALNICHGKSQREVAVADGPYPILATGGQIGTALRPLYDKPSVLIGRKGTINQPQYMQTPFWTVDTLFYSAMKGDNDAKFFYYRFCLIDWLQFNEASGVPSLNARTIEQIQIACPQPTEQTAIASVLSDMDAELSALEARRDKTRALKQGMMQELLTGRTRLV